MGKKVYIKTALTGGGDTALDGLDGNDLNHEDIAIVTASGTIYFYVLDKDNSSAESSPAIITPDLHYGTKRWILQAEKLTSLVMTDGGTIGQAAGPLLTFDDTNNYLEVSGCNVGIGTTAPTALLNIKSSSASPSLSANNGFLTLLSTSGVQLQAGTHEWNGAWFQVMNSNLDGSTTYPIMLNPLGGNVGIGTSAPGSVLSVGGAGAGNVKVCFYGAGTTNASYAFVVRNATPADLIWVRNDGGAWAATPAWNSSGRAKKENIVEITGGVDVVKQLKPSKFDYKNGPKDHLGFVAEDVATVIPEAVADNPMTPGELMFNPSFIQPHLVLAIKELNTRLSALDKKSFADPNTWK